MPILGDSLPPDRHAETALKLGATPDELLEVLRIVAGQGIEPVELALSMLETLCPRNDG
jgi:hypothetical protein